MAINYKIIEEERFLRVISTGACENLNQLKDYIFAIQNAAISSGLERIFVDETRLEYKLSTYDSFDSGRFVSSLNPKPEKLAVLCKPEGWDNSKFWETVSVNRGVPVRVFRDNESAENWILS